jgi:hypothetical protein
MAKRPISKPWSQEDVSLLIGLAERGVTLLRTSAALRRVSTSVQKKARELGRHFRGHQKSAPRCEHRARYLQQAADPICDGRRSHL